MITKERLNIFMSEAEKEAKFADCPRAQCGCFIINKHSQYVTGNNHHVGEHECVLEDNHCVSVIHAERAAICSAARQGISLFEAIAILTQRPCQRCLMELQQSGVKKVYYKNDYHSSAHGSEFVSPVLMEELKVEQLKD